MTARQQIEQALASPGCERLKEWEAIGPVQRAALEEFAGRIQATCKKCGGAMKPSKAIAQTYSAGSPDFPVDSVGMTFSPAGPGALIDCEKCEACGWSVTAAAPSNQGER